MSKRSDMYYYRFDARRGEGAYAYARFTQAIS